MITRDQAPSLLGATAYSSDGQRIGTIGQIFFDDATDEPRWATVATAEGADKERFVPLEGARMDGPLVRLAFDEDRLRDAPAVDPARPAVSENEERDLYRFYGQDYGPEQYASGTTGDEGYSGYAAGAAVSAEDIDRLEARADAAGERFRVRLRRYLADPAIAERPVDEQARIEDADVAAADTTSPSARTDYSS